MSRPLTYPAACLALFADDTRALIIDWAQSGAKTDLLVELQTIQSDPCFASPLGALRDVSTVQEEDKVLAVLGLATTLQFVLRTRGRAIVPAQVVGQALAIDADARLPMVAQDESDGVNVGPGEYQIPDPELDVRSWPRRRGLRYADDAFLIPSYGTSAVMGSEQPRTHLQDLVDLASSPQALSTQRGQVNEAGDGSYNVTAVPDTRLSAYVLNSYMRRFAQDDAALELMRGKIPATLVAAAMDTGIVATRLGDRIAMAKVDALNRLTSYLEGLTYTDIAQAARNVFETVDFVRSFRTRGTGALPSKFALPAPYTPVELIEAGGFFSSIADGISNFGATVSDFGRALPGAAVAATNTILSAPLVAPALAAASLVVPGLAPVVGGIRMGAGLIAAHMAQRTANKAPTVDAPSGSVPEVHTLAAPTTSVSTEMRVVLRKRNLVANTATGRIYGM